jgi:hypothetical protein
LATLIGGRRATATYDLPDGGSVAFKAHRTTGAVAATRDVGVLGAAIREARNLVPGHPYQGFGITAKAAGCAGYMVSFPGKRAPYVGRAGDTHVEYFPGSR